MKKKNLSISFGFRTLSDVVMFFFTRIFNIKADISKDIMNLTEPYLLLANHVGFWDPFIIGYFLRKKPHFVASDAVMKDPVKRFFLKGFKIIPKKKNERDSQVIRDILEHLQHNEAVALFPEATRTWTGETMPIDDSIGKLVKLGKVKVITAKMKGMFLFNPRWAYKIRKSGVKIVFEEALSADSIKTESAVHITEIIRLKLTHNEWDYQQTQKIKIQSNKRAEFLNHVLFYCPKCQSMKGYSAHGNKLTCENCGNFVQVNKFGFLQYQPDEYKSLVEAYDIQNDFFRQFVIEKLKNKTNQSLFDEKNMKVYTSENDINFTYMGMATIYFFADFIKIEFADGKTEMWPFEEIKTLNPQLRERIEMNTSGKTYRFIGQKKGVSGIKWEIAINFAWLLRGENYKLSGYLRNIVKI